MLYPQTNLIGRINWTFSWPNPIHVDGIERYKEEEGEDDLTSKLIDVMKEPHGVPFPPNKQYAKNILKIVKCSECAKCRVLYARIKLKLDDQDKVKKPLKNHICISFVDIHKNPMAYDRENISFSVPIETTYYGTGFPDICVYCGTSKNLRKSEK